MNVKMLESVHIDMKNGVEHVGGNDKDISSNSSYPNLTFENGK